MWIQWLRIGRKDALEACVTRLGQLRRGAGLLVVCLIAGVVTGSWSQSLNYLIHLSIDFGNNLSWK